MDDAEVELCVPREEIPGGNVKHVVMDNDGTVSVLRQGWEHVMEDMMMDAILGDERDTAEADLVDQVRDEVRDYIDRSTGVQTILQMEHLVEMVQRFDVVREERVRDKHGYKEMYDKRLEGVVNRRIKSLKNGRMAPVDFTIKGALRFLKELHDLGITLYLASGTDRDDVRREAAALGCDALFDGGIYGAVGDVSRYSKKKVINDIMTEHDLAGPELAVIGDGPVELRECRKQGGIPIGIASNEIRRYGLDAHKRPRLIRAGAYAVAPDFSWKRELLTLLCG
jgi:phosphoglycolate phosphatase-like HAD superfamily hydrolase